jgi:hypothetical protein
VDIHAIPEWEVVALCDSAIGENGGAWLSSCSRNAHDKNVLVRRPYID